MDILKIQRPGVTESVVEGFGIRGAPYFDLSNLVLPVAIVGSSPEDGHLGTVILVQESDGEPIGTAENPMHVTGGGLSSPTYKHWAVEINLNSSSSTGSVVMAVPPAPAGHELAAWRYDGVQMDWFRTGNTRRVSIVAGTGFEEDVVDVFQASNSSTQVHQLWLTAVGSTTFTGFRAGGRWFTPYPASENPTINVDVFSSLAGGISFRFYLTAEYLPSTPNTTSKEDPNGSPRPVQVGHRRDPDRGGPGALDLDRDHRQLGERGGDHRVRGRQRDAGDGLREAGGPAEGDPGSPGAPAPWQPWLKPR